MSNIAVGISALKRQAESLQSQLNAATAEKHGALSRAEAAAARLGKLEEQLQGAFDERDREREERLAEVNARSKDHQTSKAIDQGLREEIAALQTKLMAAEGQCQELRRGVDQALREASRHKEEARSQDAMAKAADEALKALEADMRIAHGKYDTEVHASLHATLPATPALRGHPAARCAAILPRAALPPCPMLRCSSAPRRTAILLSRLAARRQRCASSSIARTGACTSWRTTRQRCRRSRGSARARCVQCSTRRAHSSRSSP